VLQRRGAERLSLVDGADGGIEEEEEREQGVEPRGEEGALRLPAASDAERELGLGRRGLSPQERTNPM